MVKNVLQYLDFRYSRGFGKCFREEKNIKELGYGCTHFLGSRDPLGNH